MEIDNKSTRVCTSISRTPASGSCRRRWRLGDHIVSLLFILCSDFQLSQSKHILKLHACKMHAAILTCLAPKLILVRSQPRLWRCTPLKLRSYTLSAGHLHSVVALVAASSPGYLVTSSDFSYWGYCLRVGLLSTHAKHNLVTRYGDGGISELWLEMLEKLGKHASPVVAYEFV
jgi:hypothetical protein